MGNFKIYNFLIISVLLIKIIDCGLEEKEGVIYANECEVCKILAIELQNRLLETGKSHDVLELGYQFDDVKPKKRKQYAKSELRFIETTENLCDKILEYSLHKERKDSTRFAKGMPETFRTLHGLVDKGVKVELGIPLELWDKPPAEVTKMKQQCEVLWEKYEDEVQDWYFNKQEEQNLIDYLCADRALQKHDKKCLTEVEETKPKSDKAKNEL